MENCTKECTGPNYCMSSGKHPVITQPPQPGCQIDNNGEMNSGTLMFSKNVGKDILLPFFKKRFWAIQLTAVSDNDDTN